MTKLNPPYIPKNEFWEREERDFKFVKVEDFFRNYSSEWFPIGNVQSYIFDQQKKHLFLSFMNFACRMCVMEFHIPRKDTFRVQFSPRWETPKDVIQQQSRSVVMDTSEELYNTMIPFELEFEEDTQKKHLQLTTRSKEGETPFMKIIIDLNPFRLSVYKFNENGDPLLVHQDAENSIYYRKTLIGSIESYSIIQAKAKPKGARYAGFGGRSGESLFKNGKQLTFFNYDNMRYRQIYNEGPTEDREPLYDSNPFFLEFNRTNSTQSVYGIFVDNTSETFFDIGSNENEENYLFGSLYGPLDYYFFLGKDCREILKAYSSFVGHSHLKPRYSLGYHQGCYGYDTRAKLEKVAEEYRKYQIPLDGLHIDVDLQDQYRTFTISSTEDRHGNPPKFPDPKRMFRNLREKGIKCSTNITPIISNRNEDMGYETYRSGTEQGVFITDERFPTPEWQDDEQIFQNYEAGEERYEHRPIKNRDHTKPFLGEVYYGEDSDGTPLGTTGHYPDLARKEVRKWWGNQYHYLFEMGLEMVWQDMTTPCIRDTRGDMKSFPFNLLVSDNSLSKYKGESENSPQKSQLTKTPAAKIRGLYAYNLHKATYHGLNNLELESRKNKRNFIVGRGGFTGMHRFAALWCGDNASTWDFLRTSIPQILGLGIGGQCMAGADIGGFENAYDGEKWADPELLMRWVMAGSFLPWFRNHYNAKIKNGKLFQEPYAYDKAANWSEVTEEQRWLYQLVLPVCRNYINLRYRLMQLFYDALFENTQNGMPIARAMFLNDQDPKLFLEEVGNSQFFVRKDLLVAPILKPESEGNGEREVYLPAGSDWYAFVDNQRKLGGKIEGGKTIRNLDGKFEANKFDFLVPVYVRAGAIIPTIEQEQYVGELNAKGEENPITLNIYPGGSGEYTMYLDDGVSRSSAPVGKKKEGADPNAKGEYREVKITHKGYGYGSGRRKIEIKRVHDNYTPKEKFFRIAILHDPFEAWGASGPLKNVTLYGNELPLITGYTPEMKEEKMKSSQENCYYHDENVNISFIKIFDNNALFSLELRYERAG